MSISLGDYLDEASKKNLIEIQAEVGAIYLTDFDGKDDGFVLKAGKTKQSKFFIIIGNDSLGNAMGVIFINTDPHPKTKNEFEFMKTQYFILRRTYPQFLEYDSYVDCSQIRKLDNIRMKKCKYIRGLETSDLERIIEMLKSSDTITAKEKRKYGII
jgi:hypothetical protein